MPRIPDNVINDVRAQADIVEIIKDYIPLTSRGKNYFGVCPFHQDHSPSMSVSKEKQMFKCFSCGAAGNVFKFVSDFENISYIDAVLKVANKVGMNIAVTNDYKQKEKYEKEYEIMNLTTLFYQNNLNTDLGISAKKYLLERGLNDEMIKDFNLGLAFDKNTLLKFLKKKKVDEKDLVELGLVNQNGLDFYDVFSERIIFPIHDALAHVVGFTARVYQSDKVPKYLNSKETKIFRKGNILFNYHRAKDSIRLAKKAILVEGNMDAIRMYACGFKNTIALMGTSMTKEQIVLLQKLRVPIILMFDNDEAGKLATLTNGELLINAGLEVQVVRLSGEKDPDEYIVKQGIEAMQDNINHPLSFLEFKYSSLKENKNLENTEELAEYVHNVLSSIAKADSITRDITLNKLAEEFHLSYDVLNQEMAALIKEEDKPISLEPKIEKKRTNRYDLSAQNLLYAMMNDIKYVVTYKTKLGFFKDAKYRSVANEIIYYTEKNKTIEFADFLTFAENSPLKDEIYLIIKSINHPETDDTSIEDYIFNIKEIMWSEEKKKLKEEQKRISDVHKKEAIGKKIVDLTKKIQEIREERSVKK